jgi:rhodanese-related sulfurtransferase
MNFKIAVVLCVLVLVGVLFYVVLGRRGSNTMEAQTYTGVQRSAEVTQVLSPEDFQREVSAVNRVLLDVRTPEEYAGGHLQDARNIDFNGADFARDIESLDRNAPYAVYCRSGNRSGKVVAEMRTLGFTNVIDLRGGVLAWEREGRTVCTEC